MTMVAVASGKGSPGATTLSLVLAAVWPRPALLAEVDPAGTDLAFRVRDRDGGPLVAEEGLLALVEDGVLDEGGGIRPYLRRVGAGPEVLIGPPPARTGALAGRWTAVADLLADRAAGDVVADCGRFVPGSPVTAVLAAADAVLLVVRPMLDNVAHALARADDLAAVRDQRAGVHFVVITDPRDERSAREIDQLAERAGLRSRVLGRLADDPAAVGLLGRTWSRRLAATLLVRSARELAERLAESAAPPASR